ncbi:hypothetical protein P8A22_06440 [Streptomyces laculatispora]|uniref:PilZ domain-containing protein n=1 Tax=Streptomyces laculatispora TaxID=887464 RepID=A0ABY9HZE9_9ACTN|nr:hypothetical protein [Streptomyces laculatispora]WLQ39671.1 hypothetical protein P8A22_06440 [Streptomyces laculatispora]
MPHILRSTQWQGGPAARTVGTGAEVVVGVTEFVTHRPWSTLSVGAAGLRLRRTWPLTPGAVGMWLWVDMGPRMNRSGSITVWTAHEHLLGFVARPDHRRIVSDHRDRGTLRSAAWTAPFTSPAALRESAWRLVSKTAPWPASSG